MIFINELKLRTITLLFFLSIFTSCRFSSPKTELFEIDISKNHPLKELHIQTVADVEYIPLETTDAILLDSRPMLAYVSNKYIFVWQKRGDIFIFDRNGKAVFHFNRLGNGTEEYSRLLNAIFDEKNEEVFVCANLGQILVYSPAGEYKRTLKLPDEIRTMTVYNFDDETILVYDETGLQNNQYKEEPYLFISKQDGSIVSTLNLRLPLRYPNRTASRTSVSGETQPPVLITIPNNIRDGGDFVIANISSDTIYTLTKSRNLAPMLIRKPSVHSSGDDVKIVLTSLLSTDKFFFLWKTTLDAAAVLNNQNIYTSLLYEKETGNTSHVSFINDDFPSRSWIISVDNLDIGKNMTADFIETHILKEAFEEKKLKGELEKLTATLDEEDNPLLMIVKFR